MRFNECARKVTQFKKEIKEGTKKGRTEECTNDQGRKKINTGTKTGRLIGR
jgi:hypothetical protein